MGVCYILDHVRLPDFAGQQYDPDALIRFDRRDMTDQQNIQLRTKQGIRIMFLGAVPWAQKSCYGGTLLQTITLKLSNRLEIGIIITRVLVRLILA